MIGEFASTKSTSFMPRFFIGNYYNCSGDYRDAHALIGRELRHILR